MVASWLLKLDRAHHHLDDICAEIAFLGEPGLYTRQIQLARQDDPTYPFGYFLSLSDPADTPLPVLIGDFLFNTRSALDHVVVASVPPNRRNDAMFPIYAVAPRKELVTKTAKSCARRPSARTKATRGMSTSVLKFIESCQPYDQAAKEGTDAHDHPLAVLSDLQNTDKHRSLNIVAQGLRDIRITVTDGNELESPDLPDTPRGHFLANGARILSAIEELEVEVVGSLTVAVASTTQGIHREIPESLEKILDAAQLICTEVAKRANL